MIQKLKEKQLVVAPGKVQKGKVVNYLGTKIFDNQVSPQKIQIQTDNLRTLNDFQKLLGDIQWVRPYLGLTNKQLQPLYDILPGDIELNSPRQLTDSARVALSLVEKGIQTAALKRRDLFSPIILCILPSETQPNWSPLAGRPFAMDTSQDFTCKNLVLLPCLGSTIGLDWPTTMYSIFWQSPSGIDCSI